MSVAASSPGGGIEATIVGSGFPSEDTDDFIISLCGNEVTQINSISSTEVVFTIPPEITTCASATSEITFGGQTATIAPFAYSAASAPTITSLSPNSSSPILKSTLTITGSNFGSQANTKVYLSQEGSNVYELGLISVSSTEITCILGGGLSGEYNVVVVDSSVGASLVSAATAFEYRIFVDSLSISTGSSAGGYEMTITGRNLAPSKNSNTVFFGNGVTNEICEISSISDTQVVCIVPRMNEGFTIGE